MAGLTKQHFKEIARIININHINRRNKCLSDADVLEESLITMGLIEDFGNYFKTQNPLFDENRFKEACLK